MRPDPRSTTPIHACRLAALAVLLLPALLFAIPAAADPQAPDGQDTAAATPADDTATPATDIAAGTGQGTFVVGRTAGNAEAIDDQTLARQRGGAAGVVMVVATPQLARGISVTLWDEIGPPAPLPVPVDASQAAQGNIASYTRR